MITARIKRVQRFVNGKMMQHSDVFIEDGGRTFYTRYWHEVDDTPHGRAAEVANYLHRKGHWLMNDGAAA